jgi:hypothetical protein
METKEQKIVFSVMSIWLIIVVTGALFKYLLITHGNDALWLLTALVSYLLRCAIGDLKDLYLKT